MHILQAYRLSIKIVCYET